MVYCLSQFLHQIQLILLFTLAFLDSFQCKGVKWKYFITLRLNYPSTLTYGSHELNEREKTKQKILLITNTAKIRTICS